MIPGSNLVMVGQVIRQLEGLTDGYKGGVFMHLTTRRKLKKPDRNDRINIADLNYNADILDDIEDQVIIPVYSSTSAGKGKFMCDGVDDDVQILAAINSLPPSGGIINLASGVFKTNASIVITNDKVTVCGQGRSTIIQPENFMSETENHIIRIRGEDCVLENFVVDGINRSSGFGILPASAHRLNFNRLEVRNCPLSAIYIMNSLDVVVQHCYVHNNQYSGITLSADNGDVFNARILYNRCEYNGLSNDSGDRMGIHCEGWVGGNNVITGSYIHGNVCKYNGRVGIYLQRCTRNIISENICAENQNAGIHVLESTQISIIGNDLYSNAMSAASGYKNNLLISDYNLNDNIKDVLITGNRFNAAVETHIRLKGNADYVSIVGNDFVDKPTSWHFYAILESTGTHIVYENNLGPITESQGTATIASGAISATVALGLDWGTSETSARIVVIANPTNNLGAATKFWINNITSTTFNINVDIDPGTSGATFVWHAKFMK